MRLFLGPHTISSYSKFLSKKSNVSVVRYSSLRPSSVKDSQEDQLPYSGRISASLKVKPKREPFLKNVLVGKYDVEMLVYPEVLDLERLKNIDQLSDILNRFWNDKISQNPKYFNDGAPAEFLSQMTNFGLMKQKVPYSYDGLELSATESAKIVETMGKHIVPINILSSQNIVQEIISMASEDIKDKYLNNIVKNNWKGAICLNESHAEFDVRKSETKLTWSNSDKSYGLNGQKIWVADADKADFFIVLGKYSDHGVDSTSYAAVVVDKTKPGITINKHLESGFFIVEFKNVNVNETDFLIEKGAGLELVSKIQSLGMLYFSSGMVGLIKDVFDHTTQFLMYRPFLQGYSSDSEAKQVTLAKLAADIHALESMVYFTSNLIDGYDNQDCEVEIAVLKLFASQVAFNVVNECINMLGPHVAMHSYQYPFFNTLCAIKRVSHLNVSDDLLQLFVAIKCIDFNKNSLREYVKKIRKPYVYMNEAIKHKFYIMRNEKDEPPLDLKLEFNLHPSLQSCARTLEYCIKRIEFANITLLENYGAETYDHHYSLVRLTNVITDIYAMTCVVARASRSYCTGIQNSDLEVKTAELFCHLAQRTVRKNISEIIDGPYGEIDMVAKNVSEKIFDSKGYYAQHPLARNII